MKKWKDIVTIEWILYRKKEGKTLQPQSIIFPDGGVVVVVMVDNHPTSNIVI